MTGTQPGMWKSIRTVPRPAWVLFAGTFVNRFGSFVLVFLVLYLTRLGFSPAEAGSALSLYGIGSMAAVLVGGHLADRIGRRRTIALSMFSGAATMLALSQARTLPVLLPLTWLAGFTAELYRPASTALIADLLPVGERVTAYALYRLAINAGFAAGPAVAGFLATSSFTWLFIGDAITSVIFGVVALVALPETTIRRGHERGSEATVGYVRHLAADRPFVTLLACCVAIAVVFHQSSSTLALHVQSHGMTTETYGLLMSLNGLLIVGLELPIVSVTRQVRPRAAIATGLLLTGLGFGLTGWATTAPLLALTVVIWTFGEMVFSPVAVAYVADLAPERLRARYQAAFGMTFSLGMVLAPLGGMPLYAANPSALWWLCLAVGIATAAIMAFMPERALAAESTLGD